MEGSLVDQNWSYVVIGMVWLVLKGSSRSYNHNNNPRPTKILPATLSPWLTLHAYIGQIYIWDRTNTWKERTLKFLYLTLYGHTLGR